jgi:hypothetical protein
VSSVTASVVDTLRAVGTVLVPLVARGVIIRRPRVAAVGERLDADRRLVRTLQRLRARYGTGPLRLRLLLRRVVLVLSHEDAHRVLDASPDPYATAARAKKAALGRFEPHGVLISDAADRPDRRRWNEVVLDTSAPLHHLAGPMVAVVREEADALLAEVAGGDGVLDWPRFVASWFRIARRVTLGDAARDDTVLTDQLARLRGQARSGRSARRCVTRSSAGCVPTSSGPSRAAWPPSPPAARRPRTRPRWSRFRSGCSPSRLRGSRASARSPC